jgi:hypothetical protein
METAIEQSGQKISGFRLDNNGAFEVKKISTIEQSESDSLTLAYFKF